MRGRRSATGPALSGPIPWGEVPKSGGGVRRVVELSRIDGSTYARSVAGATAAIGLASGGESHANRVVAWDPILGPILEPWRQARRRWRSEVLRLVSDARFVAVTDVRSCYGSISPGVVTDRLRCLGAPEESVREVGSWLSVLRDAGVDGLAVGPAASAVLADAVLSAGDDAVRATGAAHVRWVDDVAIFARDARSRAAALEALRRTWGSLGLDLHEGKTALFEGPAGDIRLGGAAVSPAASCPLR